jgi:hypothetical protein
MPNRAVHERAALNKSNSGEIVTRSHKITEMCHVACGLHMLPCGVPLFSVIFHREFSPADSGWNGLNIELEPVVVFYAMTFVPPASGRTSTLQRMTSSGMLCRVALVRTDVSEELSASIIRVTRIGELGTSAVTSNRRTLRRNTKCY